jgi:hypothetical protein
VNSRSVTFDSFRRLPREQRHAAVLAQERLGEGGPLSFTTLMLRATTQQASKRMRQPLKA